MEARVGRKEGSESRRGAKNRMYCGRGQRKGGMGRKEMKEGKGERKEGGTEGREVKGGRVRRDGRKEGVREVMKERK
jgi:hypothetical protein